MSLSPVAFIAPNYRDFKGQWIKAYEPGTTTPKTIYTDADGTISVAKLQLNADGFIVSAGGAIVMPYIDGAYDVWLFPTEFEADSNDTTNAQRLSDNLSFDSDLSQSYEFSTVADYKAFSFSFPTGKIVTLLDRGAKFTVLDGISTANGFNIIASDTGLQSISLIVTSELMSSQWGSVESTTVDSSLVIQAMGDFSTPGAGQIITIEGNVLFETKPIILAGVSIVCTGVITSDAPVGDSSLSIGSADIFTVYSNIEYDISIHRKIESDFSINNDIGVLFDNVIGANINLRSLRGFTVGGVGRGNTSTSAVGQERGFAWNKITLGDMDNNLIGFDFRLLTGAAAAFANQNNIHHYGRIQQRNAVATAATTLAAFVDGGVINAYAIRGFNINGNHFYDQSLELSWTRPGDGQVFNGTGFLFDDCVNNKSTDSRFENAFAVAKLTGNSKDNFFSTLYSDSSLPPVLIDESDSRANELSVQDDLGVQPKGASWDSGPLAEMTQQYSSGKICTVGASWTYTSGGNEPTIEAFDSTMQVLPDGLLLGSNRGVSYRLETQRNKKFVIRRVNKNGELGRILISARKADGAQWTSGDVNSPYVRSNILLAYTGATFAGWKEPSNSDSDLSFTVNDDVDHVIIQFSQGILQRVQIQSLESGSPVVTSGFIGFNTTQRMTKISPVDGWWTQGEEAVNFNATAGQPTLWKAEQNGWACGSIWVITTAYAVNDIRYNGANVYICRVAGVSSGAGGPAGTSKGVIDGTVTWDYVGSRVTFRGGPLMP